MYVSSAITTPENAARPSSLIASRMRCMRNQAVRALTPYLRSISRAATPFFDAHISKITKHHVRTLTSCRA